MNWPDAWNEDVSPTEDVLARSQIATDRVIGRRFGIVRDCREVAADLFGLSMWQAVGPRWMPGRHDRGVLRSVLGCGIDRSANVARVKAVAEAIERFCLETPRDGPAWRTLAKASELDGRAVDPTPLGLHWRSQAEPSSTQVFDSSTETEWCATYSLSRNEPVWCPTALVWGSGTDPLCVDVTSTGVAAHVSRQAAALSGLLEVLERDAFISWWYAGLPAAQLDARTLGVDDIVGRAHDAGLSIQLLAPFTDLPLPTVIAIAWGSDGRPCATVGVACRANLREASEKACSEVLGVAAHPRRSEVTVAGIGAYASPQAAAVLREFVHRVSHNVEPPAYGPARDIDDVVARLTELQLEVLVADLTTSDIARAGYHVMRVVVPGTTDLSASPERYRVDGERLRNLPMRVAGSGTRLADADLNLAPIPIA